MTERPLQPLRSILPPTAFSIASELAFAGSVARQTDARGLSIRRAALSLAGPIGMASAGRGYLDPIRGGTTERVRRDAPPPVLVLPAPAAAWARVK
jgi:hypothetical protein